MSFKPLYRRFLLDNFAHLSLLDIYLSNYQARCQSQLAFHNAASIVIMPSMLYLSFENSAMFGQMCYLNFLFRGWNFWLRFLCSFQSASFGPAIFGLAFSVENFSHVWTTFGNIFFVQWSHIWTLIFISSQSATFGQAIFGLAVVAENTAMFGQRFCFVLARSHIWTTIFLNSN